MEMERQNKDKVVTVQGADPLVPVGDSSVRTGCSRPSSSVCPGSSVDFQAGTLEKAIGRGEERWIDSGIKPPMSLKQRRRADKMEDLKILGTGRFSAPVSPGSPSPNLSYLELTWSEDEARSVKRKKSEHSREIENPQREPLSTDARLASTVRKTLKNIDTEVRSLFEWAKERNTKKEIKEGASRLRSLMSMITSNQVLELMQTLGRNVEVRESSRPDNLDERSQTVNRQLQKKDVGVQVSLGSDMELPVSGQITEEHIQEVKDYEGFVKVADKKWNEGLYKRAFIAKGTPLQANKDADLVSLNETITRNRGVERVSCPEVDLEFNSISMINANERGENIYGNLRGAFEDRYPDLKELDGDIAMLTICIKKEDNKGKETVSERHIFKVETDGTQEQWFDALVQIKQVLVNKKRTKVALHPPLSDSKGQKTRRMLECIFKDTNIKCLVYVRAKVAGTDGETKGQRGRSSKPPNTEAIIVKQQGKTYSDLLKEVRERVKVGSAAAQGIETIRKSRDGNMIIVVDKKQRAAIEELKKDIGRGGEVQVNVSSNRRESTLFIKDIDGITTKEEVMEAVCDAVKIQEGECRMGELRPYFGGNQAITIRLDKEKAQVLANKGKIRIGLSCCKIAERVEVLRCFRCWQYGHVREMCAGTNDLTDACNQCGKLGHKRKDCKSGAWCLNCKSEGHNAGSGDCPEFRKALQKARAKAKQKRKLAKGF